MKMLHLSFLLLCGGGFLYSHALETELYVREDIVRHFNTFVEEFKKEYANAVEKKYRFEIFKRALERIKKQNLASKHTVFGINDFSDLTQEEFLTSYTGYKKNEGSSPCTIKKGDDLLLSEKAPDSLDWRDQNKVTRVKNQFACGSCWAFSTIGNLEGQHAIKNNELVEFSEQQLVSCDKSNAGCYGGSMGRASRALIELGGAMTEEDYPYSNRNKDDVFSCKFKKRKVQTQVSSCDQFVSLTEDELMKVLHTVGPLAIAIDAADVQYYNSKILEECTFTATNHAVLLVGYGTENGTMPYWILKNSWGSRFGENGYFRIKRGVNACGLLNSEIVSTVL